MNMAKLSVTHSVMKNGSKALFLILHPLISPHIGLAPLKSLETSRSLLKMAIQNTQISSAQQRRMLLLTTNSLVRAYIVNVAMTSPLAV